MMKRKEKKKKSLRLLAIIMGAFRHSQKQPESA